MWTLDGSLSAGVTDGRPLITCCRRWSRFKDTSRRLDRHGGRHLLAARVAVGQCGSRSATWNETSWLSTSLCSAAFRLADNVALAAFAAARRAAARLLLTSGPPAVQQSIDMSWRPGPQQQTHTNGARQASGTDGQTDGRTPDSCIDPARRTMRAVNCSISEHRGGLRHRLTRPRPRVRVFRGSTQS